MVPEVSLYYDRLQSRLDAIKDSLAEIADDAEQLNWRPDPASPSVFALAAFVALNTDYWIGHAIGELAEPAGLDSALEQARGRDIAPLIQRLDRALETSRKVLERLSEADLDRTLVFNDEPLSARQCILQALEDAAERYGELRTYLVWWGSH